MRLLVPGIGFVVSRVVTGDSETIVGRSKH